MTVSERMATFEKRITELEQENKRLHNTIEYLTRKLFGKSSEKTAVLSLGQVSLFEEEESFFDEAENKANPEVGEPDLSKEADNYRKKRFKGQRKELLKDLEHVKKVYRLAEEDRTCDTCGDGLVSVGEEFVRSELEFIPAQVRVIDYYRETMECRTCRKMIIRIWKNRQFPIQSFCILWHRPLLSPGSCIKSSSMPFLCTVRKKNGRCLE